MLRSLRDFGEYRLERGQGLVDTFPTVLPFGGKCYAPNLTFQQDHPDIDLELLDPLRDRAARQIQLVRRALQIAMPCHGCEHPKGVEVQVFHRPTLRRQIFYTLSQICCFVERVKRSDTGSEPHRGAIEEKQMPHAVRAATAGDIPRLVELLLRDAEERHAADPDLWKIASDAPVQIEKALSFALISERQPFRQIWQVCEHDGAISGVVHSMLLPVPPIYAGNQGDPGLILPDSTVAPGAPAGTIDTLVAAAERALKDAGAKILLATWVTGNDWRDVFQDRGYDPLTLYLSKTIAGNVVSPAAVRPATDADVPGIVARSAENRQVLVDIDRFWEPHDEADARFSSWMTRSLTLQDRDMLVMGPADNLSGYVIAQPASRLHFPPAHDITAVGVIDDFYHPEWANPGVLAANGEGSSMLSSAAEAAFAGRGVEAAIVVCPARWQSKARMLEAAGYETALVWSIKR